MSAAPGSAVDPGSYRDPSGFVFWHDGAPYRQINKRFQDDWRRLHDTGLLSDLVNEGLLVSHEPAPLELAPIPGAIAVIKPRPVPFISYPYEWCFSQLKDAALLTLRVQERAIAHGMTLRDASAFNVQFEGGAPFLIDTLSFEGLGEDATWRPYRQFCEHFLAPLAVMSRSGADARLLLRTNLDGLPLPLASRLLPSLTRLNPGLIAHIHLHARSQQTAGASERGRRPMGMGKTRLEALIDGLRRTIESLHPSREATAWADYTPCTSYSEIAAKSKEVILREMLGRTTGMVVWDVGANDGHYSRLAHDSGARVVAMDEDPQAVERLYGTIRGQPTGLSALVMDVANPSPGVGWNLRERKSIFERADADLAMGLALIHHLAIARNLPFEQIAAFFAELAPRLILEWVPKDDPMSARLLATREDVFDRYTLEDLRAAFAPWFVIEQERPIAESARVLLLMRRTEQTE